MSPPAPPRARPARSSAPGCTDSSFGLTACPAAARANRPPRIIAPRHRRVRPSPPSARPNAAAGCSPSRTTSPTTLTPCTTSSPPPRCHGSAPSIPPSPARSAACASSSMSPAHPRYGPPPGAHMPACPGVPSPDIRHPRPPSPAHPNPRARTTPPGPRHPSSAPAPPAEPTRAPAFCSAYITVSPPGRPATLPPCGKYGTTRP